MSETMEDLKAAEATAKAEMNEYWHEHTELHVSGMVRPSDTNYQRLNLLYKLARARVQVAELEASLASL